MTRRVDEFMTRRAFLAGTAAGASLVVLHPFSANAAGNQAHLRIMETTDLHVHIFPYDYYADKAIDTVGLARTAALIGAIRAEATNAMLIDNGDFLQGNPMGDYIAYERGEAKEAEAAPEVNPGRRAPTMDRGVQVERVTFAHDGTPVLAGVSLSIPARAGSNRHCHKT